MGMSIREADFTVDFEELEGSPKPRFTWDPSGGGGTRMVKCAYSDAIKLAKEFTGYIEVAGADVIHHLPHRYTDIGRLVIATTASIDPFGKIKADLVDSRWASYDYAQVSVEYSVPQFRTPEPPYQNVFNIYGNLVTIRETIAAASEFITLPIERLYWGTGTDNPIDDLDAPSKINTIMEWVYQVSGALVIPTSTQLFPGQINSDAVKSLSLGFTFPEGTLLCGNPEISREEKLDQIEYGIVLRFYYRNNGTLANPKGWNYFPRVSAAGASISWERITDGTNNKNIYTYADFGSIIV